MKIYRDYHSGRTSTLLIQPGVHHPEDDAWFIITPTSQHYGPAEPSRTLKTLVLKFENGCCETSDEIAAYLIEQKLASKRPSRFSLDGIENPAWLALYKPAKKSAPPAAVEVKPKRRRSLVHKILQAIG